MSKPIVIIQSRFNSTRLPGKALKKINNTPIIILCIRRLANKGHKVIVGEPDNLIFGGGQIIQRDPVTQVITGGTDPRQDGSVAAW